VLCQFGDHERLLCELHRARLKGVFFYQSRGLTVKPKDAGRHGNHKRHKKHMKINQIKTTLRQR